MTTILDACMAMFECFVEEAISNFLKKTKINNNNNNNNNNNADKKNISHDVTGHTLGHLLVQHGSFSLLKKLLTDFPNLFDLNIKDKQNRTTMDMCIIQDRCDMMLLLMSHETFNKETLNINRDLFKEYNETNSCFLLISSK